MRNDVGAFCRLEGCLFVSKVPKTRSGKILRGTIRKICNEQEYAYPVTIDEPNALDTIKEALEKWHA